MNRKDGKTFISDALRQVTMKLAERIHEKGPGIFVSSHEILGIVQEEVHEVLHAVQDNDRMAIRAELLDVAVATIFGIASIDSGGMDWL